MFSAIFSVVNFILDVYKLLVVVHFILTLAKAPSNKWTTLLASIVEPALAPIRAVLNKYLPESWKIADWSPIGLLIVVSVAQWLLGVLGWILP